MNGFDSGPPLFVLSKRAGKIRGIFSTRPESVIQKASKPTSLNARQSNSAEMPGVYFVFGPSHSYFFFCGGTYRSLNVPEQFVKYVLLSVDYPGKQMSRPTCITLGPTEQEYYAMYTTAEGTDRYTYDFQNSFPELMSWLQPLAKVVGTHIAIGPYRTYYACVPTTTTGGTLYHSKIPASLKETLESNATSEERKFTSQVSLGYRDSWFVLWPSGDADWDLAGQYDELEEILRDLPSKCISYVSLNPWAAGQYFLVLEDGTVRFCLPAEWAPGITADVAAWQNRFKTVTSSRIQGGKAENSTRVSGGGVDAHPEGSQGEHANTEQSGDLPPPYEGNCD